jgi:tetratricopeptide (TPR) repeat protein
MATFEYTARADPNRTLEGTMEAESAPAVAQLLRRQGLYPIRVEVRSRGMRRFGWPTGRGRFGRVGLAPLAEFTDQLADLLEAGVPLERALRLQEQHVSKPLLKASLNNLGESVRAGRSLAAAMSAWPKVFPRTYVSMINVGEEAGLLAEMLRRLARSLEEEHQLRSKLRAAMVYPLFLVCVGLGTVLVLMVWVIPTFSSFFASLEQQLPLPTMQIVGFSNSIAGDKYLYFPIVGLLLLLASVLGNLVKKNTTGVIGGRYAPVLACLLLLAGAEAMATRRYLQKWENSVSLHSHMLTIYPEDAYLHNGAGNAWMEERAYARAAYHYRRAVELQPHFAYAHCNLALVYQLEGNTKSAIEHYHLALQKRSWLPQAHQGLGDIAFSQRDYGKAMECYERAIAGNRDWWPPLNGLARLLAIHPDPRVRSPEQAVLLAERAASLTKYRDPKVLDTLALAYGATGEFEKALALALEACRLVAITPGVREGIALDEIQSHVRLYRQKKAYTADACTVRE